MGVDETQAGTRANRDGLSRDATGVDLAWTASPVPAGESRTFVFVLSVSKRVDAGLLPTRSAYAVVEPGQARLLSLVPSSLGNAVELSAVRRSRLLAIGGSVLPCPMSDRMCPFAAVFRLRCGEWHAVARRVDPPARSFAQFQVLAEIPIGGIPLFSLQEVSRASPRFRTFERWQSRGASIRTIP